MREEDALNDPRSQEAPPSALLSLPAELQTQIFEWALVLPSNHVLRIDDDQRRITQPPLTKTCRHIRQETLPLFYASARFVGNVVGPWSVVWPNSDIRAFLETIGPQQRAMITRLYLGVHPHYKAPEITRKLKESLGMDQSVGARQVEIEGRGEGLDERAWRDAVKREGLQQVQKLVQVSFGDGERVWEDWIVSPPRSE